MFLHVLLSDESVAVLRVIAVGILLLHHLVLLAQRSCRLQDQEEANRLLASVELLANEPWD